jgi:hypothetical protein
VREEDACAVCGRVAVVVIRGISTLK